MKRKVTRASKRNAQKRYNAIQAKYADPRLAIGDVLFEHFWARKATTSATSNDGSERVEDAQCLLQHNDLHKQVPLSAETKLAYNFIASLAQLHMQVAFNLLVPSYIGHSLEIDLAVQAVITAISYQTRKCILNSRKAYHSYGLALQALRQTIDFSDSSLMVVALLGQYEGIMRMHTPAQFSHLYGVAKILLSRAKKSSGPNELERALLYADWDRRLRAPVALGIVSPFEDSYWLDAEPMRRFSPAPIVKLRMLTNKLYIRLPRLVLYVRRLRFGGHGDDVEDLMEKTAKLANELLALVDQEAESFVLHGIKVVKTEDQWDKPIVSYSFRYQTLQQMNFASWYWHARLILMQNCLQLMALPRTRRLMLSQSEDELKAETKRMLTNIFMSYQYAKTLSMMGQICITQPLIVSYGACTYLDRWQELPISSVQKWIVLRINDSWGKWGRSLSSKDLEEINSVFSGGRLECFLPKVYEEEKLLIEFEDVA